MEIPNCSHCQTKLVERRTKNNRIIYACPNWLPDGRGCQGDIFDPGREENHKHLYPRVILRNNVPSKSEPGKVRTVTIYEDGSMDCNCWAGNAQKICRHKTETVTMLDELVAKITALYYAPVENPVQK